MQAFVEALKADPDHARAALDLVKSLGRASLREKAMQFQPDFITRNPGNPEIVRSLIRYEREWADELLARCRVRELGYRPRPFRISALVSTYASEEFMRECLEDLEAQTVGGDLEIIVVDADSPQGEGAIVEEFQRRRDNIRYLRTPERIGIYPAWNLAIHLASGEFLTPFSTNDRLNPDAYRILSEALRGDPGAALAYGDTYLTELPHQTFAVHARSRKFGGAFEWPAYGFDDLLLHCRVGPHPMWRREVHEEVGGFDAKYRAIGDQDFWLRLGGRRRMLHVPEFTGLAWITGQSLSGESSAAGERREIQEKHVRGYLARRKAARTGRGKVAIACPT